MLLRHGVSEVVDSSVKMGETSSLKVCAKVNADSLPVGWFLVRGAGKNQLQTLLRYRRWLRCCETDSLQQRSAAHECV